MKRLFPRRLTERPNPDVRWLFASDGSDQSGKGTRTGFRPAPLPPVCPEHLPARCPSVRDGPFSQITFIERLATKGGKAPATGCDAAHDGTGLRVDYSADCYFDAGGAAKPDKLDAHLVGGG
jgi:hypothetical protein